MRGCSKGWKVHLWLKIKTTAIIKRFRWTPKQRLRTFQPWWALCWTWGSTELVSPLTVPGCHDVLPKNPVIRLKADVRSNNSKKGPNERNGKTNRWRVSSLEASALTATYKAPHIMSLDDWYIPVSRKFTETLPACGIIQSIDWVVTCQKMDTNSNYEYTLYNLTALTVKLWSRTRPLRSRPF